DTLAKAWPWLVPAVMLAIVNVILVWRRATLGFVGTWFFAVLSPTLVVPLVIEIAAERRMYIPLMAIIPYVICGCYIMLLRARGAAASRSRQKTWSSTLALTLAAALALTVAYCSIDIERLQVYKDSAAFWMDAEQNQPESPLVQLNVGSVLELQGKREEAISHYRRAVDLRPNLFAAHFRLAEALRAKGQWQEAEEHYREAVRYNPEMASGHFGLAQVFRQQGKRALAQEQLEQALLIYPDFARAHFVMAIILEEEGDKKSAKKHYEEAISAQANFPAARRALGLLPVEEGNAAEAVEQFRRMPPSPDACANLAVAYARLGRSQEALNMAQAGAMMARSQGQPAEAARIEAWAADYQAGLAAHDSIIPPNASPPVPLDGPPRSDSPGSPQ
ncbi:MAG: tetratricopeptide repeat protein, partial [Singulisphaera sp.]